MKTHKTHWAQPKIYWKPNGDRSAYKWIEKRPGVWVRVKKKTKAK